MLKKFKSIANNFFHLDNDQTTYASRQVEVAEGIVKLRELVPADIKELLSVERNIYQGELPWTKSAFLSELKSPILHLYLGITQNDRLLGYAGCRIIGTDAHVTNIGILSEQQGKGLGTILIDELIHFAQLNECETMSLEVRVSNLDAQRLYRKHGFEAKTVKKAYYSENQEDALDMVKLLEKE
ncbi:MAG: ribosomal protein S18-alanine N-acetyltransferase [Enterococcus sp.]